MTKFPIVYTDGTRVELYRVDTTHPASSYGLGVVVDAQQRILDGATFRTMRDLFGFVLLTDDIDRLASALGVPVDEPGLIHVNGANADRIGMP
jgi:hypothetical protein